MSRPISIRITLAVALAGGMCAGLAGVARAQKNDAAAGEALFQEGRRLMKNREFAAACPKLEESFRLDPALGTLVNLASCEEELGHTASAWQHWRAAADQLDSTDKRRATAVTRAAALEKVLARLTITMKPGAPETTEVVRDGVKLGQASLGLALPVDPGHHIVVVSAPGHETRSIDVTIAAKERRTLVVEPGAEKPEPRAEPAATARAPLPAPPDVTVATARPVPPTEVKHGGSAVAYGLLGVGVAALGVAGFSASQALSARKDAEASCMGHLCSAKGADALDKDKRYSLITDISGGAALLLVGVGVVLLLRGPGDEASTTALVSPLPGGGGQLQLGGRF
jgi:hypothetical protein